MRFTILLLACCFSGLLASAQTEVKKDTSYPVPNAWVENIPVFEEFDYINSIFNQNNDTTYVINFWATWCAPCVAELPYFEEVQAAGGKTKVILVSLDFPSQFKKKLVPFVQDRKLQSTVWALADTDHDSWINKVSPEWTGAIPITVVYKGDHREVMLHEFESADELKGIVKRISDR